ncbi:MAG: HNH endonuclease [Clostridiales bacterium]|nr:HNH endonuclease [Clostridiales bacterium]
MVKQAPQDFKCSWTEESENKDLKEHLIEGSDPYESVVVNGEAEGQRVAYYTTKYERNAKNRKEAIRIHGFNCAVCGFNFEEQYGELGKEFIEVHHLKPLYSLSETVIINPKTDLACVCANCHRMIHPASSGAILADLYFQQIGNTVEISWNNQDAEDGIRFTTIEGGFVIDKDIFVGVINAFLNAYAEK